ncbi:hypothetical protein [Micromonospora sp. KC723]|uniref:LppU/SCO3897 family protein n=1 Tax=Micromonospora sp. KC723 TaxID=2530381 RepID=UPI0010533881|nr:hypothetical protein [Micromonospora sp. KC723]TDB78588.1 hypothetical protein E1165_00770 [Micromonospora sp. KC723]
MPYQPGGSPAYLAGPTPPRPRRGRGPLRAVLAVLAAAVLGGTAVLWYRAGATDDGVSPTEAGPTTNTGPDAPVPGAVGALPTAPAPASSADPRFVKVGECVRNTGPVGGKPKLLIADCAPQTYEVLRRFDGQTSGEKDAEAKCGAVAGYTDWFFYDSELDSLDFVLCLRQR